MTLRLTCRLCRSVLHALGTRLDSFALRLLCDHIHAAHEGIGLAANAPAGAVLPLYDVEREP